jgi:hypothetical protein
VLAITIASQFLAQTQFKRNDRQAAIGSARRGEVVVGDGSDCEARPFGTASESVNILPQVSQQDPPHARVV